MMQTALFKRVRAVLPTDGSRQLFWLALAMAVGAALETFSLGLIMPVASIVLGDWASLHKLAPNLIPPTPLYGSTTISMLLIIGACALVFLLKNAFLAAHAWYEVRFAANVQAALGERVLETLLTSEDERRWSRPAGTSVAMVTADVISVLVHSLLPLLTIFAEGIFLIAISIFLLVVEPQVTLAVFAFVGSFTYLVAYLSRHRAYALGNARQAIETQGLANLNQVFVCHREVVLYGAEKHIMATSGSLLSSLANIQRQYQLLSTLPRFPIELLAVFSLLTIVATGVLQSMSAQDVLVRVSLFTAAGFRVMIGANRVLMSVQHLRFGHASMERVTAILSEETSSRFVGKDACQSHERRPLDSLCLRAVSYRYGEEGAAEPVFRDVSLCVKAGELVGLIGDSGSGKSTVLDLIAGLRRPTVGEILADGKPVNTATRDWRDRIGYVSQNPLLFPDSLKANIAFGVPPEAIDPVRLKDAIEGAKLDELVRNLPQGLDTHVGEGGNALSGGQRQRIAIARALYRKPDILLLDEPTSALDMSTELALVDMLVALKAERIILVVSHRQAPLAKCDSIISISHGRITDSGTGEHDEHPNDC